MSIIPSGDAINRLDLLGRVVNSVGVPLLLVFIMAVYFGYIRSPLDDKVNRNEQTLERLETTMKEHQDFADSAIKELNENYKNYTAMLERLIGVIKMIDCGEIPDAELRQRCLAR